VSFLVLFCALMLTSSYLASKLRRTDEQELTGVFLLPSSTPRSKELGVKDKATSMFLALLLPLMCSSWLTFYKYNFLLQCHKTTVVMSRRLSRISLGLHRIWILLLPAWPLGA
jgi:hypothetical protein